MPANRVFLRYRIITHKVITMKTNLKAVRKAAGLTQEKASELSGVPLGTLRRWEQGVNEPDVESIIQLASLYGVTTDTLLGSKYAQEISSIKKPGYKYAFIDIPVMGEIAAGTPIDMTEIIDSHPCPKEIADKHPNSGWLRVEGDSYNKSIPNGCLALVDFDMKEPNEHSPFAVCVNGYKATIKRVKRLANGYELIPNSYDPTYLPMIYDYNKDDTEQITIIGQVVYAAFPFDWTF